MITIDAQSYVVFAYNRVKAGIGGAISLVKGTLIADNEANLIFRHNFAFYGGAINLVNSTVRYKFNEFNCSREHKWCCILQQ
jgi:uncharacterized membrane protein